MAENNEPLETISVSKSSLMSFLYVGILVALVLGGFYYYTSTKPDGTMVDEREGNSVVENENEIVEQDNLLEDVTGDSESIDETADNANMGKITGRLCFPSSILPAGEIAVKNLDIGSVNEIPYGGTESTYTVDVTPGKYVLRYQAHAGEGDEYMSGYYTLCGNDGSYETCSMEGAHNLIEVNVAEGETATGIDLCDFYYEPEEEPQF